jgi:hypothetical protein
LTGSVDPVKLAAKEPLGRVSRIGGEFGLGAGGGVEAGHEPAI